MVGNIKIMDKYVFLVPLILILTGCSIDRKAVNEKPVKYEIAEVELVSVHNVFRSEKKVVLKNTKTGFKDVYSVLCSNWQVENVISRHKGEKFTVRAIATVENAKPQYEGLSDIFCYLE